MGGGGERAAGAGGCPGAGGRPAPPRSSQTRRRCAGRGKSRWVAVGETQCRPVRGEMAPGGEDAEDRNQYYRPGLHLGASPPWVPRRREGAAVRRRLELASESVS